MSIFTQRVNEHSSIIPSGFTGYIVRNSNVIIDKSYIEKGTSFVNAFDNSNTLIKDCGTPVPSVESNLSQYVKLHKKISNETEKKLFPFWFHYKVGNALHLPGITPDNYEHVAFQNDDEIKISVIRDDYFDYEPYNTIAEYRNDLINSADSITGYVEGDFLWNKTLVEYDQLIERRLINEGKYESKNIDYTTSGAYYFTGLNSSIRAVFPLNNTFGGKQDIPNLVLNFKNREYIPTYKYIDHGTGVASNNLIYVNSVIKYDKYNIPIEAVGTSIANTDEYVGVDTSAYVHKYIAKSVNSNPVYESDSYETIIKSGDTQAALKIEGAATSSGNKHFIMGPYTKESIAYYKYDSLGNNVLQNSSQNNELTFYFKYDGTTYSLFRAINGIIGSEPIDKLTGNNKYVYDTFLQKNLSTIGCDLSSPTTGSKRLTLDIITVNNVRTYQPENLSETCNFIGFKKTTLEMSNVSSGKLYNSSGISVNVNALKNYLVAISENKISDTSYFKTTPFCYGASNNVAAFKSGVFLPLAITETTTNDDILRSFYTLIGYQVTVKYDVTVVGCDPNTGGQPSVTYVTDTYNKQYYKDISTTIDQTKVISFSTAREYADKIEGSIPTSSSGTFYKIKTILEGELYSTTPSKVSSNSVLRLIPIDTLTYSWSGAKTNSKTKIYKLYGTEYSVPPVDSNIPGMAKGNFDTSDVAALNGQVYNYINKVYTPDTNSSIPANPSESGGNSVITYSLSTLFSERKDTGKIIYIPSDIVKERIIPAKTEIKRDPQTGEETEVEISPSSITYDTIATAGYYQNGTSTSGLFNNLPAKTTTITHRYYDGTSVNTALSKSYFPSSTMLIPTTGSPTFGQFKVNSFSYIHEAVGNNWDLAHLTDITSSGFNLYHNSGSLNNSFLEYTKFSCSSTNNIGTLEDNVIYSTAQINNHINSKIKYNGSNASKRSFTLMNFFKKNDVDKYVSITGSETEYNQIAVYPGVYLTTENVQIDSEGTTYINLTFDIDQTSPDAQISFDTDGFTSSNEVNHLILYSDSSCTTPVQLGDVDQSTGGYTIYQYNAGRKIYDDVKGQVIGNVYVSYNYKKLRKFEYLKSVQYEYETVKDWINVNAYIDCSDILRQSASNYSSYITSFTNTWGTITAKNVILYDSQIESRDTDVTRFLDNCYVDDSKEIATGVRHHVGTKSIHGLSFRDNSISNEALPNYQKISSLFTDTPASISGEFNEDKNFSYKSFSFNFKIPKYGWATFNREMYKDNPYYMTNILTNGERSTLDTVTTPVSQIQLATSSLGVINGEFTFLYGVLDNRVVEQVVGTGNYGDGGYRDPKGVYHTGAKIDPSNVQMGGVAEKFLSTAYNVSTVRIPFYGRFESGGNVLQVTSPNDTLSFTVDFKDAELISGSYAGISVAVPYYAVWVDLNGFGTTTYVNGIQHHIIIPSLKLFVAKTNETRPRVIITAHARGGYAKTRVMKNGTTSVVNEYIGFPNDRTSWHAGETGNFPNTKCIVCESTVGSNDQRCPKCGNVLPKISTSHHGNAFLGKMFNTLLNFQPTSGETKKMREIFKFPYAQNNNTEYLTNGGNPWSRCLHHWIMGNMAPNEKLDENGYPYTYLPLCTIAFSPVGTVTNQTQFGWTHLGGYLPAYTLFGGNWDNYYYGAPNYVAPFDTNNKNRNNKASTGWFGGGGKPYPLTTGRSISLVNEKDENGNLTSMIMDAEPLVMPTDFSTNLFYYKGSLNSSDMAMKVQDGAWYTDTNEIFDRDEVVIINARKMYSESDDIDNKPTNSTLALDLSNLENTEIILTSLIRGNEETLSKFFNEVNVYVNNNLEYTREPVADTTLNKRKCRYTDAHSEGLQWKLFELNKNIEFSTISNFNLPLTPVVGNGSSELSGEVINVPSQLSMSISGLVFQQQCRAGISFDEIEDVLFDQRVIAKSVFGGDNSKLLPGGQYEKRFGLLEIGTGRRAANVPADGAVPSAVQGGQLTNKSLGYYLIKRSMDTLEYPSSSIGGSDYYNDFYSMKMSVNSANKWETYHQDNQFSKLLVYPDYNPRGDRIIGIPYLNQEGKIILREQIATGSSLGGAGNIHIGDSVASVAKIATDISYVNPVLNVESIENFASYPSSIDVNARILAASLDSSSVANIPLYTFIISGSIGDYETNIPNVGVKYFTMGPGLFTNLISGNVSGKDEDYPEFGIYFDGLPGHKEVVLKEGESGDNFKIDGGGSTVYYTICLNKSFVNLTDQNGEGVFYGTITIQLSTNNPVKGSKFIELHNFKLPAPVITSLGVSFGVDQREDLDFDGYLSLTDDIWQQQVFLNNTQGTFVDTATLFRMDNTGDGIINYDDFRIHSSSQPGSELSGNSTVLTDDNGEITGLLLTVKIPGLKMFKQAGMKYFLENKQEVTLSSSQMLEAYKHTLGIQYTGDSPNKGKYCLGDEYDPYASIGSTVTSGNVTNAYNYIETKPMKGKTSVGHLRFKYNPVDDDKFQLEVITKSAYGKFNKTLYYVNKEIDKWYNLSIFKTVKSDQLTSETSVKIGFLLNDVDGDLSGDISSLPHEIFNCQVVNDSHVDGISMDCKLGYNDSLSGWQQVLFPTDNGRIESFMKNWKSLYDIKFNKCMRSLWDCKYANDPKFLANSTDETEDEYLKRRNLDLYKISDSLNGLNFKNPYGEIKLFANAELSYALGEKITANNIKYRISSTEIPFYNLYVGNDFLYGNAATYADASSDKWLSNTLQTNATGISTDILSSYAKLRERLLLYRPRRILFNNSTDNYILRRYSYDQIKPQIKSCEVMVNNVMFISTPNLYHNSGVAYTESYNESLGAVNEYDQFFGNAQHRLPPVSYENHILGSDYATFIYGNSNRYEAIEEYNDVTNISETIMYNYGMNPSRISFTWGNSQVSRSETVNSSDYVSRLHWNKASFTEYVSEVGSVYNFTDSQHVTNIISVETGSINERQCVLLPVLTSPLEYEKRSSEEGVIKVTDNIIATSALGYNTLGYPKNGILSYNTNGNVYIDSTQRNYIFIEQQGSSSSCSLGATIQKPVFIDSVTQNIQSLHEGFIFLPNPDISISTYRNADEGELIIQGGSTETDSCTSNDQMILFNGASIGLSAAIFNISEGSKPIAYSDTVVMDNISIYNYPPLDSIGTIDATVDEEKKHVKYIFNTFAMPDPSPRGGSATSDAVYLVDKNVFNVFYNEAEHNTLQDDLEGTIVGTTLTTLKCFNYEGKLWDLTNSEARLEFGEACSGFYSGGFFDNYIKIGAAILEDSILSATCKFDLCPTMGVIWSDKIYLPDTITYNTSMGYDIETYGRNRNAVMDQYCGVNLSAVKFKIDEEHLKSAPTYIEIGILKYDQYKQDFYWEYDPSLDFDIRDTYESTYDYDNPGDRFIEKVFVDDGRGLSKNAYGIKFMIKEIVPQSNTFNACHISNIQVMASNMLNPFGLSRSVEDVYVRRIDANYSNAYDIKCSEYVWRLPNSKSEWQAVITALESDNSLEVQNSLPTISGYVTNFINGTADNIEITQYTNQTNFSKVNTFYISNNMNQNNEITDILSDNYLVDSNIQISWKYIDYVYIYYSCYSFNAKELLDLYFGDKIYAAVRAKLINNINNLNANSAFGDRYKFGGGIAVQKEYALNTSTKSAAFEWKADVRTDQLDTYQDIYKTNWTQVDKTYRSVSVKETTKYKKGHGIGSKWKSYGTTSKNVYGKPYTVTSVTSRTRLAGTSHIGRKTTKNYLGSTLQNAKYTSVDNWTKSFSPRQIKYKIN